MFAARTWANFISHSAQAEYFTFPFREYFTSNASEIFHEKKERLTAMSESKLRDLSVDFSVKIVKLCEDIKGHYSLVNQLERAATSIGANAHEANYAHGKPDFIAKLQIALKECYETEYWLEVFVKSEIIDRDTAKNLYNQCGTIRRILISSINTTKEHINGNGKS